MMLQLAVGELPDLWYGVLVAPALLATMGIAIWVSGRRAELKYSARPWKWLASLPFALSLFAALIPLVKVSDFFYRTALEPLGKKTEIAHYAAILLPLLGLLSLAVWELVDRKQGREE